MTFEEGEEGFQLHASYLGAEPSPYIEILPTLAAIWTAWSTPRVTVCIEGTSPTSVVFERSTYEWAPEENELIRNHKVGLQIWDVRVRTYGSEETLRRDIDVRYLFLPFFFQTINLAQDLQTPWPDEETARALHEYLVWLTARLTDVEVDPRLEGLRRDIVKGAQTIVQLMGKWKLARKGRDEHWALRAHREFAASIRSLAPLMDRSREHMIHEPPGERSVVNG